MPANAGGGIPIGMYLFWMADLPNTTGLSIGHWVPITPPEIAGRQYYCVRLTTEGRIRSKFAR
jgi:hypothetical protein